MIGSDVEMGIRVCGGDQTELQDGVARAAPQSPRIGVRVPVPATIVPTGVCRQWIQTSPPPPTLKLLYYLRGVLKVN